MNDDTGQFLPLVLACAAFAGSHLLTGTPVREAIAGRIGAQTWLILFSLLSIGLLVWMVLAFGAAPWRALWPETLVARLVPLVVMPLALILVVCGYTTPNPTMVGIGAKVMERDDPVHGMVHVTRHPLMWGIALWALAHVVANGDLASLMFFGTLAFTALVGMPSMDAKIRRRMEARGRGDDWTRFAAHSSVVPFVAIVQGRARFSASEIGWWRIGLGLALFAGLLFGHGFLFGASLLPA